MVNFTLRENLIQNYTPTKIKCIFEYTLFIKSSYNYVPVILTRKRNPVKGIGTKSTLFQINSFTDQKYEVTLLQQSLATVLNEFLPQWTIELFREGFGIQKVTAPTVVKSSSKVLLKVLEKVP